MNNKGFMMTEVVVVSVIVLSVLVTMYVSYGKLFTGFKEKINYYNPDSIYKLANVRDAMIKDGTLNTLIKEYTSTIKIDSYCKWLCNELKSTNNIYISNYGDLKKINNTNQTFKDYIAFLENNIENKNNYYLIIETEVYNNYYYSYLEVEKLWKN